MLPIRTMLFAKGVMRITKAVLIPEVRLRTASVEYRR